MLRILTRLGAVLAGILLFSIAYVGPASASDASGCRIAPGRTFTFSPHCRNDKPADSYTVAFHAPDGAGSYAWSVTGDWTSVWTGCGTGDSYCTVTTNGSSYDHQVYARVVAGGTGYSYFAGILAYCGTYLC